MYKDLAPLASEKKLAWVVLYIISRLVRKTRLKSIMEDTSQIEKKGAHG